MRRIAVTALFTALVVLLMLVTACHRIKLYDPKGGVFLELYVDIDYYYDNYCDESIVSDPKFKFKSRGIIPETIRLYMYDPVTHEQVYETILPSTGGFIDVPPGTYDVIAYGMGSQVTRFTSAHNRGLLKAYTEAKGTLVKAVDENASPQPQYASATSWTLITEPDQVYAGSMQGMIVPVRYDNEGIVRLHLDLEPVVKTYTFIAQNISGLENVKSITCYITGQAPDSFLWDGHFTKEPVALDFNASISPETFTVRGLFNTFGKIPEISSQAILHVQIKDVIGRQYKWEYDITDQFDNPDNTCRIIIVTDPVHIPEPDEEDQGSNLVTVKPYSVHIYDVEL